MWLTNSILYFRWQFLILYFVTTIEKFIRFISYDMLPNTRVTILKFSGGVNFGSCFSAENIYARMVHPTSKEMFVQNFNRIVREPNVTSRQIPYSTTDSTPIDMIFQENFPIHTQVWTLPSHRNDCRQRGVIWVTYWCYNRNPY